MGDTPLCPICKTRKAIYKHRPFCSRRCANLDLKRWLSEDYAIPTDEADLPDDDPPKLH